MESAVVEVGLQNQPELLYIDRATWFPPSFLSTNFGPKRTRFLLPSLSCSFTSFTLF
jgi:hypothetical protein